MRRSCSRSGAHLVMRRKTKEKGGQETVAAVFRCSVDQGSWIEQQSVKGGKSKSDYALVTRVLARHKTGCCMFPGLPTAFSPRNEARSRVEVNRDPNAAPEACRSRNW
jgi:hypothetical protein